MNVPISLFLERGEVCKTLNFSDAISSKYFTIQILIIDVISLLYQYIHSICPCYINFEIKNKNLVLKICEAFSLIYENF